jgi:hypothetical protein
MGMCHRERYLVAFDLEGKLAMRLEQWQQEERILPGRAFNSRPLPRHSVTGVYQKTIVQWEPRHIPQALGVALGAFPKVLNQLAASRLVGRVALGHTLIGHTVGHCGIDSAVVTRHLHGVDKNVDQIGTIRLALELVIREGSHRFAAE